jgi:hypothetical protein
MDRVSEVNQLILQTLNSLESLMSQLERSRIASSTVKQPSSSSAITGEPISNGSNGSSSPTTRRNVPQKSASPSLGGARLRQYRKTVVELYQREMECQQQQRKTPFYSFEYFPPQTAEGRRLERGRR